MIGISPATILGAILAASALAQTHAPLSLQTPVQDKNFYLLSLIERTPAVAEAIEREPALRGIAKTQTAGSCTPEPACFTEPYRFTPEDMDRAGEALRRLYRNSQPVRMLVDGPLRRSGAYIRLMRSSGEDLLVSAWLESARGVNRIIDVYGVGKPPRYPAIDSAAFDVTKPAYHQLVRTAAGVLGEQMADLKLFFQPSLKLALYLLEVNKRDEAGRHEPLELRDNREAVQRLGKIRWEQFPYTVIVVPGAGSDRTSWSLSPAAKLRLELAARRFKAGKAPLILVSGGYVHPNQTQYCEALEMKKSLIADFGVPAAAILVDPHARHTTTNLRNAARLLYRLGVPFERKALITTDSFQSSYIEGATFVKRCNDELGYQPHQILGRTSAFDLEFVARAESLQIDPSDPLDP